MNDLKVCTWPIDRPVPYARNSRKIPERAIDKVAASIHEFGWRVPIVVDKDGVVICGHTRLMAAKKLGLREVPVHVADNLTPAQVKAYRLMDNRSHEDTDWDLDLLDPSWRIWRSSILISPSRASISMRSIASFPTPSWKISPMQRLRFFPLIRSPDPAICGSAGSRINLRRLDLR